MSTHTTHDQTRAAGALLALVTANRHLTAVLITLENFSGPWRLRLDAHDAMHAFEQWREALGVNPAEVTQAQAGDLGWLKLEVTFAAVPVEMYGYFHLPPAEANR